MTSDADPAMKSFVHHNKGRTPRQAHVDLGDLKDDELGRQGFSGRTAQLYRRNDPTTFTAKGDLRIREAKLLDLAAPEFQDPRAHPMVLLENEDCRVAWSRRVEPTPYYFRCADGDIAYFVHMGNGVLETEFGPLEYEAGDYLVVPKAVTHRIVPGGESAFLRIETTGELEVPDYGQLGRHAPFDPTLIGVPEPAVLENAEGSEWEVVIQHDGGYSSIVYDFHPCDVDGWKGDLFPFRFNIRDWNVIMSDTLHLPPTVHQFLGAPGVLVLHFLPRPAEGREGAERVPSYHRNADYDEVAFYHGGSFLGYPLPKGLLAHSPQGLHHGAPQAARDFARANHTEVSRIDWQIIAIDTERPLRPTTEFRETAAARERARKEKAARK